MKYAVVGDPVDHSRSPAIHNAAFNYLGIDAVFGYMAVPEERFKDVASALYSGELDGVSVTMPHKRNAYIAADEVSEGALRTGAVNALLNSEGELFGYNTDIYGVKYALSVTENDIDARVLILGYGGAAAAAVIAVEGREIYVSGRDQTRARAFIDRLGVEANICTWGESLKSATVINTTPLGMRGETLPAGVVESAGAFIDMTYADERSHAVEVALREGVPRADGLTMLVGQAVEAFEIFTGVAAPVDVMESAVRA